MPSGPDLITGSLAFHGSMLTPLEALILHHHLLSLCLTLLYRLLSSLTTGKGTDPLFHGGRRILSGIQQAKGDERKSQRNAVGFFFFERRFWGGVILSLGLVEPDWTIRYQILRVWPFPIWDVEEPPRSGCICADPEDLERYRTKTGDSLWRPRCPSLTYNRPNLSPFLPSPHHIHPILLNFWILSSRCRHRHFNLYILGFALAIQHLTSAFASSCH